MFGVFLFLVPGLYDPENDINRRVPFIVCLYFMFFALQIATQMVTSWKVQGFVPLIPILTPLSLHSITVLGDPFTPLAELAASSSVTFTLMLIGMARSQLFMVEAFILPASLIAWACVYYWLYKVVIKTGVSSEPKAD